MGYDDYDEHDPLGVGKRKRGEEKRKRDEYYDYDKPKGVYRERGGCLTLYLGCGIIGGFLGLCFSVLLVVSADAIQNVFENIIEDMQTDGYNRYQQPTYDEGAMQFLAITMFIFSAIGLASYVAAWNWKKIGVWGLVAINVLNLGLALISVNGTSIFSSVISLGILYFLFNDKLHMFE